jgi:NADPH:quinone reductase-like Zn-dependent oxidoreductase
MRAVQMKRFGGPEVLGIVETPVPNPGKGSKLRNDLFAYSN